VSIRVIGAALIFAGCGWFGFSMANAYRLEERNLRQLCRAVEYMECELQHRHTPLPQLCRNASVCLSGVMANIFSALADELEMGDYIDAAACMEAVLQTHHALTPGLLGSLRELGQNLGRFDLNGQLRSLRQTAEDCRKGMNELADHRENRLRSYETLGLCTGAALAVLLI